MVMIRREFPHARDLFLTNKAIKDIITYNKNSRNLGGDYEACLTGGWA
jgi:hypothetical protein